MEKPCVEVLTNVPVKPSADSQHQFSHVRVNEPSDDSSFHTASLPAEAPVLVEQRQNCIPSVTHMPGLQKL